MNVFWVLPKKWVWRLASFCHGRAVLRDFLLVNTTNLRTVSHRLPVIAQ